MIDRNQIQEKIEDYKIEHLEYEVEDYKTELLEEDKKIPKEEDFLKSLSCEELRKTEDYQKQVLEEKIENYRANLMQELIEMEGSEIDISEEEEEEICPQEYYEYPRYSYWKMFRKYEGNKKYEKEVSDHICEIQKTNKKEANFRKELLLKCEEALYLRWFKNADISISEDKIYIKHTPAYKYDNCIGIYPFGDENGSIGVLEGDNVENIETFEDPFDKYTIDQMLDDSYACEEIYMSFYKKWSDKYRSIIESDCYSDKVIFGTMEEKYYMFCKKVENFVIEQKSKWVNIDHYS
jgi:hypothetical protein